MRAAVTLYGQLGMHRRGRVLMESLNASAITTLPQGPSTVLMFGEEFQAATSREQSLFAAWARPAGRLLLLLPPFTLGASDVPVTWGVERMESSPRDGSGLAKILAGEVTYRLTGRLQPPSEIASVWPDLSVCNGMYRAHPASGLFLVTCLPLWSLTVLDVPQDAQAWIEGWMDLAGDPDSPALEATGLEPDHFGFLVFLLSFPFRDEEQAFAHLANSPIFRFAPERARALLDQLQERGLVLGAKPSKEAYDLVMESPYAPYVSALREVSR